MVDQWQLGHEAHCAGSIDQEGDDELGVGLVRTSYFNALFFCVLNKFWDKLNTISSEAELGCADEA